MNCAIYSLYGSGLKYLYGMEQNIRTISKSHQGYGILIIADDNLPEEWYLRWTAAFRETEPRVPYFSVRSPDGLSPLLGTARTIEDVPPMFWRLLVLDHLPKAYRYLVRDADSRFTPRECAAVQEWEKSGMWFHTMRDHPAHMREINGGMFGVWKLAGFPKIAPLVLEFLGEKNWKKGQPDYGLDQEFLCRYLWPSARRGVLQHDEFSNARAFGPCRPFPLEEVNGEFVGEVWEVSRNEDGTFTETRRQGDINSRGR